MTEKTRVIISMPLSFWETHLGYYHIPPSYLEEAKRNGGIIGRIRDGTILCIGNLSNKGKL